MQWDVTAALAAVAAALSAVSVAFYRFMVKRIEMLESLVDSFVPALDRNTSAIEKSNAINEEFLLEIRRKPAGATRKRPPENA